MDFLKEFEEYLPEWSNKKHLQKNIWVNGI